MSTADDAIEAGERELWRSSDVADYEWAMTFALADVWPVLSAGLRELHVMKVDYRPRLHDPSGAPLRDVCQHCQRAYPCATVRELDRIDKELGL